MATLALLLQLLSLTTISLILLLANASQVDNVCAQTRNPSLCKMSLSSDPRSGTAPLPFLAQITVDMAGYRANNIKQTIDDYMLRTADPALRGKYVQCDNLYLDALDLLFRGAPGEIQNNQWGALNRLGLRVRGLIDACEALFNNNTPFRSESQVVGVLADAIAVIAKNL
ncbi:hypothetical protein CASFOL_015622 [Castilleja foliolosa]|uniref:Pectinesterase inhibitor domain-containing protein n=1 Tax=Castilleja foliolosa TaxID=1961234 RepID=A0ABD3DHQ1_9LAMI